MKNHVERMHYKKIEPIIINKTERLSYFKCTLKVGDDIAFYPSYEDGVLGESPYLIRITNITSNNILATNPLFNTDDVSFVEFDWIPTSYDYYVNLSPKEKRTLKSLFIHLDEFSRNQDNDPLLVFDLIRGVLNVNTLYDVDIDWYFDHFGIERRYFKHRL